MLKKVKMFCLIDFARRTPLGPRDLFAYLWLVGSRIVDDDFEQTGGRRDKDEGI
jgi:hypothetical protein